MGSRRETLGFALVLATCLAVFFHATLLGDKVLSPADVLLVEASFRDQAASEYEPFNRLLMDPVLQFQPWLELNRTMIRQGRLPLWNPYAGCGAPHLANGQSAVFDPFHLVAYVGTVPRALGWMAAGRLWVAGVGMFLLARRWGAGSWGRWFAGLVYPFCGFLIVWLLYPVTPVAIWLPWLLLTSERVIHEPRARRAGQLAIVVGLILVGGHVQTGAHVLLAGGLFALWRAASTSSTWRDRVWSLRGWTAGIVLGLLLGAVQIIPLGHYLARSPVWGDRQREARTWWTLARPRLLDAVCTALPYAYGSQRRGHPNLARGVGVHNLNESAGGYAGLATLIWLAPLAFRERGRRPEVGFLSVLVVVGALGAFRLPPVDNLLRTLPVLDVTDNRRLSLWLAFGLSLLGGFGIDALRRGASPPRSWIAAWLIGAGLAGGIAAGIPRLQPVIRERAERHYRQSASAAAETDPARAREKADRQVRAAIDFLPLYYGVVAGELALLAGLATALRRRPGLGRWLAPVFLGLTLAELAGFGFGLNPAIAPAVQSHTPPVIARLQQVLEPGQRAIGIGEELPPNVLMRFGLSDPRNYDSIELASSLECLAPLFEPGPESLNSRRQITWEGVHRARNRLAQACVVAAVGATPPPSDRFARVERVGNVWIAWLDAASWASVERSAELVSFRSEPGRATLRIRAATADRLLIRESLDPSWRARIDGAAARIDAHGPHFMSVGTPPGDHVVELEYYPNDIFYGVLLSVLGMAGIILALTEAVHF